MLSNNTRHRLRHERDREPGHDTVEKEEKMDNDNKQVFEEEKIIEEEK